MGKLEALVKHGVLTFFLKSTMQLMKLAAPLRGWMSSGNHLRCDSLFVEDWMWYFGKRLSGHCFLPPGIGLYLCYLFVVFSDTGSEGSLVFKVFFLFSEGIP